MKDSTFLKEHNGRLMWHPMTSSQDSIEQPPKIITGGDGVSIVDVDGHRVVDGVGGLWNVNLGYPCQPVKDAISQQLDALPYELSEFFAPDEVCPVHALPLAAPIVSKHLCAWHGSITNCAAGMA